MAHISEHWPQLSSLLQTQGEREGERERKRKRGSCLNTQAFSVSGGVSHSHAGCLHWHTGLVQYYATLPSLFGIVCFASCLHIWTHTLVRKQPPTIRANHRHHGTSLPVTGKADAWSLSKTKQRLKMGARNAIEIQDHPIGSYKI